LGRDDKGLRVDIIRFIYKIWRDMIEDKMSKHESLWWRDIKKVSNSQNGRTWCMDNIFGK